MILNWCCSALSSFLCVVFDFSSALSFLTIFLLYLHHHDIMVLYSFSPFSFHVLDSHGKKSIYDIEKVDFVHEPLTKKSFFLLLIKILIKINSQFLESFLKFHSQNGISTLNKFSCNFLSSEFFHSFITH